MATSVAVIVLTHNEEDNLRQCLQSVHDWAREVWVVDSHSTDSTEDIARRYGSQFVQHRFEDYARQRNWALDNLPITAEWILFLDADEWLPAALKTELSSVISNAPDENGFFLNRRMIWMGRWIRWGYYPNWILRVFRRGKGRCGDRPVNEHIVVDGSTGRLNHDFIHEDHKGLAAWLDKHIRYARMEAEQLLKSPSEEGSVQARVLGSLTERRAWLRKNVYNRMPALVRPWFYFGYRYILRGGFLDGREGFMYHFLQALWYYILIDVNCAELSHSRHISIEEPAAAVRPN